MKEFKGLVQDVLDNGQLYNNGKGNCLGVIGAQVKYDISETLPVVTGKKTNVRWAIAEMAMFIKGISHLDFLRTYGAEKIWEGQSLSKDHVVEGIRSPVDVIEDYATATNTTPEEAGKFMYSRAEEYQVKRMALLQRVPAAGSELQEGMLTQEQYQEELAQLDTWLEAPFRELNISLKEEKVIKTQGDLGPIYGKQWRNWRAVTPSNKIVELDQIRDCVIKLQKAETTRQAILTSWNPVNIISEEIPYDEKIKAGFMGQPPCHVNYHFLGRRDKDGNMTLNTTVWLRSNDLMLGHPFNAIGGTIITHLMANALGWKVGQLTMQISDAHLYEEHIEGAKAYMERPIHERPTFKLPPEVDIFNFEVEDLLNAVGEYTTEPYMPFELKTRVELEKTTEQEQA